MDEGSAPPGAPTCQPAKPSPPSTTQPQHYYCLPTRSNRQQSTDLKLLVLGCGLVALHTWLVHHNAGAQLHMLHMVQVWYPYVTGTSVLGITYKDGVLLASDTLGAYGSTKRYKSFERLRKVNDVCVVGASGELSDFQYIMRLLEELSDDDFCMDDGHHLKPHEVHSYLCRVLYNRRNKMDPLWNSLVVGGFYGGKPFLGTVGMIGTNYTDDHVATGFGNHLARPLMREKHRPDMSEEEATALMHDCLKVCYYRDKNSINKFQLAKVTAEGVTVSEPFALETNWNYTLFANPAANAPGTW
ncbi:hypothetical protein COHA_000322 [Chlorella ohadii]|uniref:Proteasome subunit beta n=1 Tax=Chlorella ohadii TaxID=2649997 RepID=A0AAD5DXB1_9CHLO|nr:hypothetical protein COHA_000322 [Chlorella ohadii]